MLALFTLTYELIYLSKGQLFAEDAVGYVIIVILSEARHLSSLTEWSILSEEFEI